MTRSPRSMRPVAVPADVGPEMVAELDAEPDATVDPPLGSHHGPLPVAVPPRVHSTTGRENSTSAASAAPIVSAASPVA